MQPERHFQLVTLEHIGVQRQQVLEYAQLEGQEMRAEHLRVKLEKLLKHRVDLARARRFFGTRWRLGGGAFLGPELEFGVSHQSVLSGWVEQVFFGARGRSIHHQAAAARRGSASCSTLRASASATLMPSTPADKMPPA